MTIPRELLLSKLSSFIACRMRKLHANYEGQHNLLNNLLVSPGDEYFGIFDRTYINKTISDFRDSLTTQSLEIIVTDIKFDSILSVFYHLDIFTPSEGRSISLQYDTNSCSTKFSENSDLKFEEVSDEFAAEILKSILH